MGRRGTKEILKVPDILQAIRESKGMISVAAQRLGTSYQLLRKYADRYPEIQEAIDSFEEQRLDFAELKLTKKIQEGNLNAIMFYLERKGRKRGYGREPSPPPPPSEIVINLGSGGQEGK